MNASPAHAAPSPYWQSPDGRITVYHSRWEDAHAAGLLPVREVALVHADPPYGIGQKAVARGQDGIGRGRDYPSIVGNDAPFDPGLLLSLPCPLVLWGANHYSARLPSSATWIVWDKREGMQSNDGSDAELAWCSPGHGLGERTHVFRHLWNGLCRASEKNGKTGPGHAGAHLHPTQKPIALSSYVFARAKQLVHANSISACFKSRPFFVALSQANHPFASGSLEA